MPIVKLYLHVKQGVISFPKVTVLLRQRGLTTLQMMVAADAISVHVTPAGLLNNQHVGGHVARHPAVSPYRCTFTVQSRRWWRREHVPPHQSGTSLTVLHALRYRDKQY